MAVQYYNRKLIEVNEALWQEAKRAAMRREMKVKEMIEFVLKQFIEDEQK